MKICPKCHKIYEDSQNFCSEDGSPLELTPASKQMREEKAEQAARQETAPAAPEKQETITDATPVPVAQQEESQDSGEKQEEYAEFKVEPDEPKQDTHNQWQNSYEKKKNFDDYFRENIPNAENWKEMYLSLEGRLTRSQFVCRWLLLILAAFLISLVCAALPPLSAIGSLVLLAISIMQLTIGARRLHDTDHSAWYLILTFIPGINLLLVAYMIFKSSYPADNKFGPFSK